MDNMEHAIAVDELHKKMEIMISQINKFSGPTGADLRRMLRVVSGLRHECSRELVTCRRLGKPTSKYLEVYAKFSAAMENLDTYLIMLMLSRT